MAHSMEVWKTIDSLLKEGRSLNSISKEVGVSKSQISKRSRRNNLGFKEEIKAYRDGSLYIIRAGNTNIYKIGVATDIGNRIKNLQTGHYEKLTVVRSFYLQDVYRMEKALHSGYSSKRIRGEWFNLTDEELKDIEGFVYGYQP